MYQTGVRHSARNGAGRKILMALTATGVGLAATLAAVTTPAGAETGNLPGGTSISVDIVTPADNSVHPPGTVSLSGTAEVGTAAVVANTGLITVVDTSGSTAATGAAGCGNPNPTDSPNSILDCEIIAAANVNTSAASLGTVASVGTIAFATNAVTADVNPAVGEQSVTTPTANNNPDLGVDIEAVFRSMTQNGVAKYLNKLVNSGSTNYTAALQQVTTLSTSMSDPAKVVLFMSDGAANNGGSITTALNAIPADTTIHTFAIGNTATCTSNPEGFGTLQQIANATGGTCTKIVNANNLPSLVPGVIAGQLLNLNVSVDGGAPTPISNATVTPDLPVPGPATVDYTVDVSLTAGPHELCVSAGGSDAGGPGSVEECINVLVQSAPEVDAGGPYTGVEGSPITLAGAATDPDNDPLTTLWTISGVTGGPCAITDAGALDATLTCDDDAIVDLTLSADDGAGPPITDAATATVGNADPVVSLGDSSAGLNQNKVYTATFTDAGSADTHACSFAWGDGSPDTAGAIVGNTCTASHAYATSGDHTVTVSVTDDDGGGDTDTATVVVNSPPEVDAGGPYAGNEGSAIPLSGTITDPDGDPVTHSWAITGVAGGASCALAGGGSLTPTVTCNDNAVVTVTLTADDGVNAPVTDTAIVIVANVNPTVVLTAPGSTIQGTTVTFTAAVSDAGAGDTHTCTFQWGDTSPNTTVPAVAGVCSATHTMTTTGLRTVKVIATDDDGGTGSDTVSYMVAYGTNAWVLEVSGVINPGKQAKVACPPLSSNQGLGTLNIGVVFARTLSSFCRIFPAAGTTVANSAVERLDLLNGAIRLTGVEATCTGGPGGITRSSTVATLNGTGIGSAPATIDLGVAVVHLNENTVVGGKLTRHAVRIEIRPVVLLGLVVVPSTSVTAAGCTIG